MLSELYIWIGNGGEKISEEEEEVQYSIIIKEKNSARLSTAKAK